MIFQNLHSLQRQSQFPPLSRARRLRQGLAINVPIGLDFFGAKHLLMRLNVFATFRALTTVIVSTVLVVAWSFVLCGW